MELGVIIWSGLLSFVVAVIMFLINRIFSLVDKVQKELTIIQKDVVSHYTRRDDFIRFEQQVLELLRRIEDKLDGKVDKR